MHIVSVSRSIVDSHGRCFVLQLQHYNCWPYNITTNAVERVWRGGRITAIKNTRYMRAVKVKNASENRYQSEIYATLILNHTTDPNSVRNSSKNNTIQLLKTQSWTNFKYLSLSECECVYLCVCPPNTSLLQAST